MNPVTSAPSLLTKPVLLLMALATGLAVASNYYAQPLLHSISQQFSLSNAQAGSIVMIAQLGYAGGMLLLAPLGDLYERRRLIVLTSFLSCIGLLVCAFAPSALVLMIGTGVTGVLSASAQLQVTFAAALAHPLERGKAVGIVMSGLLLGILLARTFAGILADVGNWRTVYWVAAVATFLVACVQWRIFPRYPGKAEINYLRLIGSMLHLFIEIPVFRARALLGALIFALFSMFWTPLTFLLASPPYAYSDTTIGLFGLAGATGALAANRVGGWVDRGLANHVTRISLLCLLASWALLAFGKVSLFALLAGVLLLDLAIQAIHVTNSSCIQGLRAEARSRLASGYMTCYFLGGACGSLFSAWMYTHFGWLGVTLSGAVLSLITLLYGLFARHVQIPKSTPPTPAPAQLL